ncbi:MAG: TIGR02757 family protein [Ignavibacteriaceae bacterium]|nr:TIGR02757 family protein [Ignavibacteriaceae bacterium]
MTNQYSEDLKLRLEYHYNAFDKSTVSPDPVEFPHRYSSPQDIELAAFLSSVFAYGGITQIMKTLESLFEMMGPSPFDYLTRKRKGNFNKTGLYHRFYSSHDVETLLAALSAILLKYGSIGNMFTGGYDESDINVSGGIEKFSQKFTAILSSAESGLTHGLKHILPAPSSGSACKRMNLFLRWMIRKDEIDFGLWRGIPPSKLIIPVDVHIARIAAQLGLTGRKNVNWKMAEEITAALSVYDSADPVKYDFALCHIGMRKLSF